MSYAPTHVRPVTARTWVWSAVAVAALWALVLVMAYGGLHTTTGQALDDEALSQAKADRNLYFPVIALRAAQMVPELVALVAGVVALMWVLKYRRWSSALCAVGMIVAANVSTQLLKHGVLTKPDLGIQEIASNSFPSGHTTATATALMAMFLVAPRHLRPSAGRWGATLAAFTGMVTVLNGWHRPTDAAGALLIVGGWGVVAALAERVVDQALERSGYSATGRPSHMLRQYRDRRERRREESLYRDDRGESGFIPPPGQRLQCADGAPYGPGGPHGGAGGWGASAAPAWGGPPQHAGHHVPYGHMPPAPGYPAPVWPAPARPHVATAVTMAVLTAVLLAVVVYWPTSAVAGTWVGRLNLIAGYAGIATAAVLSWSVVARWLRSRAR